MDLGPDIQHFTENSKLVALACDIFQESTRRIQTAQEQLSRLEMSNVSEGMSGTVFPIQQKLTSRVKNEEAMCEDAQSLLHESICEMAGSVQNAFLTNVPGLQPSSPPNGSSTTSFELMAALLHLESHALKSTGGPTDRVRFGIALNTFLADTKLHAAVLSAQSDYFPMVFVSSLPCMRNFPLSSDLVSIGISRNEALLTVATVQKAETFFPGILKCVSSLQRGRDSNLCVIRNDGN